MYNFYLGRIRISPSIPTNLTYSYARKKNIISLRDISKSNWHEITQLSVSKEQQKYIANNSYSLVEAIYTDHCVVKGIYANDTPVGLMLYKSMIYDLNSLEYNIIRFMIDARHQNKGFGRKALQLAINHIRAIHQVKKISICYDVNNHVVHEFYKSFGFVEVDLNDYDQLVAEIDLR